MGPSPKKKRRRGSMARLGFARRGVGRRVRVRAERVARVVERRRVVRGVGM
jgi:hypothetical protein